MIFLMQGSFPQRSNIHTQLVSKHGRSVREMSGHETPELISGYQANPRCSCLLVRQAHTMPSSVIDLLLVNYDWEQVPVYLIYQKLEWDYWLRYILGGNVGLAFGQSRLFIEKMSLTPTIMNRWQGTIHDLFSLAEADPFQALNRYQSIAITNAHTLIEADEQRPRLISMLSLLAFLGHPVHLYSEQDCWLTLAQLLQIYTTGMVRVATPS